MENSHQVRINEFCENSEQNISSVKELNESYKHIE